MLPKRGTQQPAERGPLERPGAPLPWNNHARGLPGACWRGQLDSAARRVCTRAHLPWGPFPPGQERSLRPAAACGDQAPLREGAAPPCPAQRLGAGAVWCHLWLLLPVIAPPGRRRPKSPDPAEEAPCPPQDRPRRPQQTTCQSAPYPGLATGAQDPGERPHPSPTPWPCAPGARLSSTRPPPRPIILSRRPLAKAPHTPQLDSQRPGPRSRRNPSPRPLSRRSAGRKAAPRRNSPAPPSPAPGGSRPWLRLSVAAPQLPGRRQKPAVLRRQPPRRPSAPPRRRGLSRGKGWARSALSGRRGSSWKGPGALGAGALL